MLFSLPSLTRVQYVAGDQVIYAGHLWTAKWWSYADTPGGAAGDWTDDGACESFAALSPPTGRAAAVTAVQRGPAVTATGSA